MPGVVVHPSSPGPGGFDPLHTSSSDKYSGYMNTSVADIKNKAKETVLKQANQASPHTLIRTARAQVVSAKEREGAGDLAGALENYIMAATLIRMTLDSSEFKQEKGRGGTLRKEVNEFLEGVGGDLTVRTQGIEEKLKAFEASKQANNPESSSDMSTTKSFGSIADRMRALQDSGLSIGSSKLLPREAPNLSNPPLSPTRFSLNTTQPSPSTVLSNAIPSTSTSSTQPPHTFVPPSSFGPPSPGSSPSSSPQINTTFELAGFAQAFPSIDELDEDLANLLPSVPTGIGAISTKASVKDIHNGDSPASPSVNLRNFALHIERPSSTPITPTSNVFTSRPASPTRQNAPPKPSGLSSSTTQPTQLKNPIPKTNTAFPKDLINYMRDYNVLLIDVRNRADFDREHIKAGAVVCIEPTVLMRENVTAEALEDAMVIAPKHEAALFANRDKFDLVAVCDESSKTFGVGNTPLATLVRIISEQAFRKILKRMPMLLVGGIEGWKRDLGGNELVQSEGSYPEATRLSPSADKFMTPLSSPPLITSPKNPFVLNGFVSSPSLTPSIEPRQAHNPFRTVNGLVNGDHRPGLDRTPSHSRFPAEINHMDNQVIPDQSLQRRPAIVRPSSSSISFSRSDNGLPVTSPPPTVNGSFSSITYPQFTQRASLTGSGTTLVSPPDIASPPIASINPSPSSWRRNDYVDQTQEALSSYTTRAPIDYPELLPQTILRPPPAAVSSSLERQDNRPRVQPAATSPSPSFGPKPPRISSDYPVPYWSDIQIGLSGLKNLGNTCYMNAPIQCLSAAVPFARFFTEHRWKNAINYTNPLGSKGRLTGAFAKLLYEMWGGDMPYLTPIEFRKSICQLRSQYDNSDQHDSQEFLSFLMDGIHEDLNRVMVKPVWAPTPEQEAELERLPSQIASEREWRAWKARNDSLIVDFFQGQFRSRLECLTCHQTSTTYNVFSILQLPIPHTRSGRVQIDRCLDEFFNEEVLEKDDAWDCPKCKAKRRASKKLSLARLPPILLIHLKRFEANGRFSDKVDTFVEFPMKSLDLTNHMPAPLPPGADKSELNGGLPMSLDDPRTQLPPYRYDLYGVTNHYGNLTSGHYTAFVASRGGWIHCDDSSVKAVDPKQVVNQKAYVLFYKRVRS